MTMTSICYCRKIIKCIAFQISGKWVDGRSFCYPWLRPEKQRGVPQVSALNPTRLNFTFWFLWWIREPRFCRTCSSPIWGALKSRVLSFNETWKAGVCHRLLLKIQHDWIFYFDYCDESVGPDFAGLLALSHDEVPSRLLLVSALTLKSEFFFNLPYKDWIVWIDVFQVNAQIVPEIV